MSSLQPLSMWHTGYYVAVHLPKHEVYTLKSQSCTRTLTRNVKNADSREVDSDWYPRTRTWICWTRLQHCKYYAKTATSTHISGIISAINSSTATMMTPSSADDCKFVIRCRALFNADEKLFGKGARLERDGWLLTKTCSNTCLKPSLTPTTMSSSVVVTRTLIKSSPLLSKNEKGTEKKIDLSLTHWLIDVPSIYVIDYVYLTPWHGFFFKFWMAYFIDGIFSSKQRVEPIKICATKQRPLFMKHNRSFIERFSSST